MILHAQREKFEPIVLGLLRIAVGIVMATHGWEKAMNIPATATAFTSAGIPYPEISTYLAITGELFGGLGLLFGLFTPIAALGIFCTMAVAVFHVHWGNGLLAKNNGFEYPLTLMTVALYFIVRGGGSMSLDALFSKRCCKVTGL